MGMVMPVSAFVMFLRHIDRHALRPVNIFALSTQQIEKGLTGTNCSVSIRTMFSMQERVYMVE